MLTAARKVRTENEVEADFNNRQKSKVLSPKLNKKVSMVDDDDMFGTKKQKSELLLLPS